jgi:hypothetical protein
LTTDAGAAGAAQSGDNGGGAGGGGFQPPAWLPGVDADTAKFITDKTVADLPGLAKGYVEAQRALSQPRAFEMPKEGDAEGLKKLHAALGVPEAPDKYDFGEPGKTMHDDARKFWAGELHKLGIPNKAAQGLVGLVAAQAKATQEAQEKAYGEAASRDVEAKLSEWGDKAEANKDLASRGIAKAFEQLKIENNLENRAKLERALGTRGFLDLGLLLGRQMVEAGFVVQDGQHRGMTKEGAVQRLNAMMVDGEIAKALTDKRHAHHQKYVSEKIALENIAHT